MNRPRPAGPVRRRARWVTWVPVAVLALLLVEVWLLVQLGQLLGAGVLVLLLAVETLLGVLVLRRAGRRAAAAFRAASAVPLGTPVPGRAPGEVGDALLTGAGGVLLVLPGVLGDVLGLACLLGPSRRALRRAGARWVRRRVERAVREGGGHVVVAGETVPRAGTRRGADDDVVEGEVLDGEPRALRQRPEEP